MKTSFAYLIPGTKKRELPVEAILQIVANYFNLTLSQIKSKTRKEEIRLPRQIAQYLYKRYTKHSLAYIGKLTGNNMNHATVLHSFRTVAEMIETGYISEKHDINVRYDIASIEKQIHEER